MKKTYILGTVSLAMLMIFGSCKKDDGGSGTSGSPTIDGKTKMEIVMMQPWRWANELDSAENGTEWKETILECNKDDVYTFKSGGKVSVNEGAKDCDPGLADVWESTWSMPSGNSTSITIHGIDWTIVSQTAEEMIFEHTWNPGSEDHIKRQTWKRN